MDILVLGATGRVGSRIVSHALADEHVVTVLVRTPDKIQVNDKNLHIIQGDVLNKDDIESVMSGVDIVISTLNTDGTNTLSESMQLILEAMKNENVKRIITVGTAGILQSRVTPSLLRYQSSESKRKSTHAAQEHHRVFEMLTRSEVEWTIVCPTYLPDGECKGNYRVERSFLPEGGSVITVGDTAEFTYQQIKSTKFLKSRVGIAY
ncbi:NAD(P)-dependent oxidoreductase [Lysinibacillus sp. NPDC097287]|uniref:NAD(P)-dependent oxidoreductase n=1 Tax=Lysinibacillus sp. NPDC097287 TaxID=3364144 RepID=UPI00381EBDAC